LRRLVLLFSFCRLVSSLFRLCSRGLLLAIRIAFLKRIMTLDALAHGMFEVSLFPFVTPPWLRLFPSNSNLVLWKRWSFLFLRYCPSK
jgi:hypothetical protein